MALFGILFISAFIPIYEHFLKHRTGYSIVDFLQTKGEIKNYLYKGVEGGQGEYIRRGDAIVLAYKNLSKDFGLLIFGVGMGNVTSSHFGSFDGKYLNNHKAEGLALTHLFWELGLLGVIVYVTFLVFYSEMLFYYVNLMTYSALLLLNVINFMFWYFSGIVATKTSRMKALSEW